MITAILLFNRRKKNEWGFVFPLFNLIMSDIMERPNFFFISNISLYYTLTRV